MSAKISTLATIAVFLVLAACTTATPTIPAPIQGPFLTEAEVISIARTYVDRVSTTGMFYAPECRGKLSGSTARFTGFIWVVALAPACTVTIDDRTGSPVW